MRDEAYRAVIASILLSNPDDTEKESAHITLLLAHLRKIFQLAIPRHDRLVQECLKFRTYVLETTIADIPPTKNVLLIVDNGRKTTQHTLNGGETYEIDLGPSRDVHFYCQVVKLNGQKAKAMLRKTTLFRRMIPEQQELEERISTRSLPLDERIRRAFSAKGTTYHADFRLTKQMSDSPLPKIEFSDLVEFVRTVHENEAPNQKPVYSGELQERSFSLLHLTFIFYEMQGIYLKLISLCVFLVWDSSVAPLAIGVLPSAIQTLENHQEQPEICRVFTHCIEYLFDCVLGVIDDLLAPAPTSASQQVFRKQTRLFHAHSSGSEDGGHRKLERQKSIQSRSSASSPSSKPRTSSMLSAQSQTSTLLTTPHASLERRVSEMSTHSSHSSKPISPPSPVLTRPTHLASGNGTTLLNPSVVERKRSFLGSPIAKWPGQTFGRTKKHILERSISYHTHPKLERVPSTRSAKAIEEHRYRNDPPMHVPTLKRKSVTLLDMQGLDLPLHLRIFPPNEGTQMQDFNRMMLPIVRICALSVWDFSETHDPATYLANKLKMLIALAVQNWIRYDFVTESQDVHTLCAAVQRVVKAIYFNQQPYSVYFEQFSINYLKLVFETLDSPLEGLVRNVIETATFTLNSRDFNALDNYSKNTMKTYRAIKNLRKIATSKGITVPLLSRFEQWFSPCLVFWTTAWRETSLLMVSRTAPLDDDDGAKFVDSERKLPTGLYSFLCIQKGISDDVLILELENPQHALLAAVKMVQIFSDNLVAYSRKLYSESRCDVECKCQKGSKTCQCHRSIRAANGVDHAFEYIEQNWVRFADWERVQTMISKGEAEKIKLTIEAILKSCREQCDCLADRLIQRNYGEKCSETVRLAKQLCLDRHEYTKTLASYVRDRIDSFHNSEMIINALEKLVEVIEKEFYPRRSLKILHKMWILFETEVARNLKEFQVHEYYKNIYVALKIIRELLQGPKNPSQFCRILHLKSLSTAELILAYYVAMADMEDETGEGSTICIQAAFIRERNDERISLVIKVREARIPCPLSSSPCPASPKELSIQLDLLPKTIFVDEKFPGITTKLVPISGNPKWGDAFQISISHDNFFTNGAVLSLSLLEKDKIGCEKVVGKAFFALNQMRELSTRTTTKPLCRPVLPLQAGNNLEFYQVIRERVLFDKVARLFWKRERAQKDVHINLKQLREVPRRWGSLRRFKSERFGSPRISFSIYRPQRTVSTI
ncbi:unnamed protein product, partial [Mesorhabditis belari]|uniref:C2 domain-containing protein n=1 Tax=Mesorhabditis belari TaxID=2138241 RepID=A0AAF3EVB7_9BILA